MKDLIRKAKMNKSSWSQKIRVLKKLTYLTRQFPQYNATKISLDK